MKAFKDSTEEATPEQTSGQSKSILDKLPKPGVTIPLIKRLKEIFSDETSETFLYLNDAENQAVLYNHTYAKYAPQCDKEQLIKYLPTHLVNFKRSMQAFEKAAESQGCLLSVEAKKLSQEAKQSFQIKR